MRDGCRLAARLWIPDGAEREPVPAVVEYIPYGKRLGTRDRDEAMHAWFAQHGLAALRIDLRGSGESDGVLRDEYLPQEQEDGVDAIAWVAAQPWCNGRVGLMGKSWGGFNALQIAALRPPALGAILTVCSTDDRYADDVHTMGGCLLNDSLWWGAVFFQLMAQPPDPALVGASLRARWFERLEAAEPPLLRWLRHPLRDEYWKQGSVCEDYAAITCPVYAVGGWADGYHNAIPRLLAGLSAPRRGLVGPWGHVYPHDGGPGPQIGFLQEAARWWRAWLSGDAVRRDEREPMYRVWMPESAPPGSDRKRAGRWIAEVSWPSSRIEERVLHLSPGALGGPGRPARLTISSPQTTGRGAGGWLVDSSKDQREDDADSLCFDSEPLSERIELLGAPELRLALASDRPTAFVVARIGDLAPDGRVRRVTYGLLNLTHRDGHERCVPLVPGATFEACFRLNDFAHAFLAGHRIRLALSTAYWPLVWPSPEPVELTLFTAGCTLSLPVRPPDPADDELRSFEPPEQAEACEWTPLTRGKQEQRNEVDPHTGDHVARRRSGYDAHGAVALARLDPVDIEGGDGMEIETRIHPRDPLRAVALMKQRTELRRGPWSVAVESEIRMSCTHEDFLVQARLAAEEGDASVFERRWDERIPRVGI